MSWTCIFLQHELQSIISPLGKYHSLDGCIPLPAPMLCIHGGFSPMPTLTGFYPSRTCLEIYSPSSQTKSIRSDHGNFPHIKNIIRASVYVSSYLIQSYLFILILVKKLLMTLIFLFHSL